MVFPPKPEKCVDDKDLVGLTKEELAKALEKPFVVLCNIAIWIEYKGVTHCFVIPRGYDWNGANVPWFCWLLIGQQKNRGSNSPVAYTIICASIMMW